MSSDEHWKDASLAKVYIGANYKGAGEKEKFCGALPAAIEPSTVYNVKCDTDVVGDYVKIQSGIASFKLTFSDVNVIATGKYGGGEMFNKDLCKGVKCDGYRGKQTKTRSGKTC